MISLVLYRIFSLSTAILVFEITLISMDASFTFNHTLVYILLIVYTFWEILYNLYSLKDFNKISDNQSSSTSYCNFKMAYRKIYLSILESIIHGGLIMGSVLLTLPQVRFGKGKILSSGALHMAVFLLLILISNCRMFFQANISKLRFFLFTIITIIISGISLFIASVIYPNFERISGQILILVSNYDSCTMMINTLFFCLAISFFMEEVIKKYIFPDVNEKQSKSVHVG
jgi:hypothetical protein